ncbi:MAG: TIM barrel protein [Actinomycetota bacterium]
MSDFISRIASAPISWGICEVPGWGTMLPTKRVLSEMSALELPATELGAPGFLPDDPVQLKDQLAEFNISLIGGFTPIVVHNKAERQTTLNHARKTAKHFQVIGATYFISSPVATWDWAIPVALSNDEYRHMFEMFKIIDDICGEYGLTQVMHPHLQTTVETKTDMDRVLNGCDVKWCLDTGHMAIGGIDTVKFAREAADRVGHVHLKDVNMRMATPVLNREKTIMQGVQNGLFTPLGQGDVPIAETIIALEKAGYRGWYVIEQDTAITGAIPKDGEGPISSIAESIDYLKKYVASALASA